MEVGTWAENCYAALHVLAPRSRSLMLNDILEMIIVGVN